MKLTIDKVKDCVTFKDEIGKLLRKLCDCWYNIALEKGKSQKQACLIALMNLNNKINELPINGGDKKLLKELKEYEKRNKTKT